MLETFSGYLRASLAQLRQGDSTLDAELDMASQYLSLFQIRMDECLRFRIDASAQARLACMPTLMLQPLVENAVQHGLAPRLDGGSVVVLAVVRGGRLEIRVLDDGVGLTAPGKPRRAGGGLALANLRSRLQAQFGAAASLSLRERDSGPGVEAVLELPYQRAAGAPAVQTAA